MGKTLRRPIVRRARPQSRAPSSPPTQPPAPPPAQASPPPPPTTPDITSSSHGAEPYLHVCAQAATNDGVFAVFKRLPGYTGVLEHVTFETGLEYLREIDPDVDVAAMRANDVLGSPATYDYPPANLSPTTLRYVKVACDIRRLFPNVRIIAEIGAGYGGQRFILSKLLPQVTTYLLIDLPPVLALIDRYLSTLTCPHYTLVNALDDASVAACPATDLVISNYAFAECTPVVREHYLATVLRRATCGYMTLNMSPDDIEQVRRALETMEKVVTVLPETPQTGTTNCILVYGARL